jgi:eukaryotic-like serine/threonine-protein kinase
MEGAAVGLRLGPYELQTIVGIGGMGQVWKARDTRLDRNVAIKICAKEFSERFEREAHAISALNHPNVCTLHDIGSNYLVMEFVEGPTLAERIALGEIPLDEVLFIARQIAEALEAAHEKGIIHRDLKPANVKLTSGGRVKVLDFGLAKAEHVARSSVDVLSSPTITAGHTRPGTIIGTAPYMSPEQARGVAVDRRADIWAYGSVLYELLTRKRAFEGESVTDILAAVVRSDPDWSALPEATPASIRRLLRRCLEKDIKRRLPDIGVARLEIEDAAAPSAAEPIGVAPRAPTRRNTLVWLTGAGGLATGAGLVTVLGHINPAPPQNWKGVMLGGPAKVVCPRLSPDGQLLAFHAFIDELPQLGVMKPEGGTWTILTHDRDSGYVATSAWSPDGSRIYFDRYWGYPRGIYFVRPLGGEPRLVLENAYGPEPLHDGSLIIVKLTDASDHQLFRFWPDSGRLEGLPLYVPPRDVAPILRAVPGKNEIVYFGSDARTGRDRAPQLYAFELDTQRVRILAIGLNLAAIDTWCPLAISPDGASVLVIRQEGDMKNIVALSRETPVRSRTLLSFPSTVAPLNLDAGGDGSIYVDQLPTLSAALWFNVQGSVTREIAVTRPWDLAFMPSGEVLYALAAGGRKRLVMVRERTEPRSLVETTEDTSMPAVVIAGGSLAFLLGTGDDRRIAVASLRDGRVLHRFPAPATDVTSIVATPDGSKIYYSSAGSIWEQELVRGEPRRVSQGIDATLDRSGQNLYVKRTRAGSIELYRVPVDRGDEERLFVSSDYHLALPPLSPSAVDDRGRILVTVHSPGSFYYRPAILDPVAKSLTALPVTFAGDVSSPGWTGQGEIGAAGSRYLGSLWRYRPTNDSKS